MNESTLIQLKILVERAVRPLRASMARKVKMRQELLAHVSDVYAEEAKRGDEQAALARTQARFGQAADLTRELQASVPRRDWVARFVEDLAFRPGESTLARATRHAVIGSLFIGVAFFSVSLGLSLFRGREGMIAVGQEWPIILAAAPFVFCFTFLIHWMRDALYGAAGRSWLRVVLVGGASALVIHGVTFGVCLTLTGEPSATMMDILRPDRIGIPLLPWAMLLTWVPVVATAYLTEQELQKELRYRSEWDSLPIS